MCQVGNACRHQPHNIGVMDDSAKRDKGLRYSNMLAISSKYGEEQLVSSFIETL